MFRHGRWLFGIGTGPPSHKEKNERERERENTNCGVKKTEKKRENECFLDCENKKETFFTSSCPSMFTVVNEIALFTIKTVSCR